jgi:amino acid adenylation domain-containing protein
MSFVQELFVQDALVHELFELQASAAPAATAVRFRDAQLSYGELNARANQLARYLDAQGVGREDTVVVCVEPGFEIVVALLAILKRGAVYVPLDPSYPALRIQTMLDDTQPALLLTHSELAGKLPLAGRRVLELDRAGPELLALSTENPSAVIEPRQTAYIYYTSGTTGVPKGVMASQANLASYIGAAQRRYGFTSTDIGPALARFSFSISMFELLSPLVAGGTLLILERSHVLDLARLSETLREVTYFHAGPSLLRSLLQYVTRHYADLSAFARVRHASSGGDMVPVEVLAGLCEVFENAEVFVIYGCSEISCMGTTYPAPRGATLARSYVGKPFDGTSLRVVDEELRDVPVGVVGEVLFAGPGVVKGYLNRPELTSERFLELEGLRFYRTGDRGRLNDEGLLELLGRSDFQIKLGGIRIELGEVEHHLRRAPTVANGIVAAKDLGGDEKALVAYVVTEPDAPGDRASRAAGIRRFLAQQLPEYMVPATYVEIAALPLNHNLKVDRKALPDPPREALRSGDAPVLREPETATEQRLASLWREILGASRVGLDDNFFELGGSSLLALRLILEVDRELGVTLSGLEVLRESLQLLAQLCERRLGQASSAPRAQTARGGADAVELFHFGPKQSLFGVLHGARATPVDAAALICAPVGHEYVRAHFILQRLARRLAAAGVPVLRFDYYGCGDSLGEGRKACCARWQRDIADAYQELTQRTSARRVTAIGVRLGATLLSNAASRLDLASVVLWDPIREGSQHRAELAEAHRRYIRGAPLFSLRTRLGLGSPRGQQELLGATYSKTGLRQLAALSLRSFGPASCPVETVTSEAAWLELARLEDMLPDVGISEALARLVLRQS